MYHIRFNDTYRFLTKSLSAAVDNIFEINNPLKCLKCSERFKEYDSFCYFDKLRNNVLGYKCEECDAFRGKSFETVKIKFKNTHSSCQNHNKDDTQKYIDETFLLLSKNKGAYPYEYMESFDKLEKTELRDWFSKLHGTNISKKDYDHALKVWNVFNIKNMEEYQNLYVTSELYNFLMFLKTLETQH